MRGTSTRAAISVALAVTAVVLLVASLGLGWWQSQTSIDPWTIAGHEYRFAATTTYLPGSDYRVQCSTNNSSMPGWGYICSSAGSGGFLDPYSSPVVPSADLAALYASLLDLILVTLVLTGLGAGVLCVAWLLGPGDRRPALRAGWFVLLAAALLSFGIPAWVAVDQPLAIAHDSTVAGTASVGPSGATSFWGSCASGGGSCGVANTTMSWGAGGGWYASLAAGACLFVSALGSRPLFRRPPPVTG